MNQHPLVIVTICRDNPRELDTTLASVFHQEARPERHLVVDGSSEANRSEIQALCQKYGAEYHWRKPAGIYAAMRDCFELLESGDWVWFLNATDWLSSGKSVGKVVSALSKEAGELNTSWWVGQTVVGGETPHLMKFPSSGQDFVRQLRQGSIGLPHSSTIVRVEALREVKAFQGDYRISRDYEMALRLADVFGPPGLIPTPLSVYDESGESARNAWRNVLHKSEARIKNQPWWYLPAEPFRIFAAGRREWLRRRLRRNPDNDNSWRELGWERVESGLSDPFWLKNE